MGGGAGRLIRHVILRPQGTRRAELRGPLGRQGLEFPRPGDVDTGVFLPHTLPRQEQLRAGGVWEGCWAVLPGGREEGVGSRKAGDLQRNGKGVVVGNEICREGRFLTNPREDGHLREHERKPGEWGWEPGREHWGAT